VLNGQRSTAVRHDNIGHAARLPGCAQRQCRADDIEEAAGIAQRIFDRDAGENAPVRAGDDHMPAGRDGPGWNEAGQQELQALKGRGAVLPDRSDTIETLGQQVGDGRKVTLDGGVFLPVLIDHLHERAEANGDQERDDKGRHGPAKRRLRYQQPVIGRFCDRLRQSLDRIGLDARARRVCARHAFSPLGKLDFTPSGRTPAASESRAI
jgi:hypothetical protein